MSRFFKGYERRRSVKTVRRLLRQHDQALRKPSRRAVKKALRQLLRKLDGVNITFAYFTREKYRAELRKMEQENAQ